MKIFITGLTSSALGGMEYHNLGNYVIIESFIEELQREFPSSQIVTSIQMSDDFCRKYNIVSLRNKRFWSYGYYTAVRSATDILRILSWKCLKGIGIELKSLLSGSSLLSEIKGADLIVDFSGDIYGDNAAYPNYLECNVRLLFSVMMNKPTVMLIGSPGPFRKIWRLVIAKRIMGKVDLITNREPLSTELLEFIGIKGAHIVSTACPSILFKKDESPKAQKILEYENLTPKIEPTVGLILCGWNMKEGPYDKWSRKNEEYDQFIQLIDHLINNLGLRVCIMSHQNSTDKEFNLIRGNDHRIIDQLFNVINKRYRSDQLFTLKGLYTAAMSKTIIGQFDMLISGRIHGAVQGLSQAIPTAIIDYGHEPKAHKLRGFAKLYGIEDYLCNPNDSENMIMIVDKLWERRESIRRGLQTRIPQIVDLARKNFVLTRMIYEKRNEKS